jgi:Holliday junction resolvase
MGRHQRNKGKRGEREFSQYLRALGYEARRAQQYQGVREAANSADVLSDVLGVRFEVKRGYNNEELWGREVQEWIETARDETPPGESWMIAWRRDRKQWTAIFEITGPSGPVVVQSHNVVSAIQYLEDLYVFDEEPFLESSPTHA